MNLERFVSVPISELLPHGPPMVLLDRVTALRENGCECEVTIREDSEFCVNGAVGAWVGIEYMAQAVAALAGARGLASGTRVKHGLLLGARAYEAAVPAFLVGTVLRVTVQEVLFDKLGFGAMDCTLRDARSDQELARATLTVVQVEDLLGHLKEKAE